MTSRSTNCVSCRDLPRIPPQIPRDPASSGKSGLEPERLRPESRPFSEPLVMLKGILAHRSPSSPCRSIRTRTYYPHASEARSAPCRLQPHPVCLLGKPHSPPRGPGPCPGFSPSAPPCCSKEFRCGGLEELYQESLI